MKEKASVLIVDDDAEIRNILQEFLGQTHQCVALDSADKALARLRRDSFDLVLSDISMSRMTGLEMLPHIAALSPESVVVMISGQRTIEFAIEAMRAGAFDYITKPFELSEVEAVTRRALTHAKQRREARVANKVRADSANALRDALKNEEFKVYYQPQIEIASRRIVGAEALVRWQHPQLGLLLPADFISVAEQTGLIVGMGVAILRDACSQARHWQQTGLDQFRISVNASPQQLHEPDFAAMVAQVLDETELSAASLELEVTETSLMQNVDAAVRVLARLREMGVRIAIDDFGTGYSSLSYLKRLPLDSVKLDSSFVRNATTDPDDAALVMAIITLAHNLRLKVIAEGIEREDQLSFLRLLRCDEGQGYLFGKPAPALDWKSFSQPLPHLRLRAASQLPA